MPGFLISNHNLCPKNQDTIYTIMAKLRVFLVTEESQLVPLSRKGCNKACENGKTQEMEQTQVKRKYIDWYFKTKQKLI